MVAWQHWAMFFDSSRRCSSNWRQYSVRHLITCMNINIHNIYRVGRKRIPSKYAYNFVKSISLLVTFLAVKYLILHIFKKEYIRYQGVCGK